MVTNYFIQVERHVKGASEVEVVKEAVDTAVERSSIPARGIWRDIEALETYTAHHQREIFEAVKTTSERDRHKTYLGKSFYGQISL